MMSKKEISPKTVAPRDGLDNTGTQGKDSLSDDAFTGNKKNSDDDEERKSGTGISGKSFHDASEE